MKQTLKELSGILANYNSQEAQVKKATEVFKNNALSFDDLKKQSEDPKLANRNVMLMGWLHSEDAKQITIEQSLELLANLAKFDSEVSESNNTVFPDTEAGKQSKANAENHAASMKAAKLNSRKEVTIAEREAFLIEYFKTDAGKEIAFNTFTDELLPAVYNAEKSQNRTAVIVAYLKANGKNVSYDQYNELLALLPKIETSSSYWNKGKDLNILNVTKAWVESNSENVNLENLKKIFVEHKSIVEAVFIAYLETENGKKISESEFKSLRNENDLKNARVLKAYFQTEVGKKITLTEFKSLFSEKNKPSAVELISFLETEAGNQISAKELLESGMWDIRHAPELMTAWLKTTAGQANKFEDIALFVKNGVGANDRYGFFGEGPKSAILSWLDTDEGKKTTEAQYTWLRDNVSSGYTLRSELSKKCKEQYKVDLSKESSITPRFSVDVALGVVSGVCFIVSGSLLLANPVTFGLGIVVLAFGIAVLALAAVSGGITLTSSIKHDNKVNAVEKSIQAYIAADKAVAVAASSAVTSSSVASGASPTSILPNGANSAVVAGGNTEIRK